jgi:magnesium chelatase subunit I
VARLADVYAGLSAITGKIELVYEGEREGVAAVAGHLIGKTVKAVFDRNFPDAYAPREGGDADVNPAEYRPILDWFRTGNTVDLSDVLADGDLFTRLESVPGLQALASRHMPSDDDAVLAAVMEIALDGLFQSSLLGRQDVIGGRVYRDVFDEMAASLDDG